MPKFHGETIGDTTRGAGAFAYGVHVRLEVLEPRLGVAVLEEGCQVDAPQRQHVRGVQQRQVRAVEVIQQRPAYSQTRTGARVKRTANLGSIDWVINSVVRT